MTSDSVRGQGGRTYHFVNVHAIFFGDQGVFVVGGLLLLLLHGSLSLML